MIFIMLSSIILTFYIPLHSFIKTTKSNFIMANYALKIPKLGESVIEATVTAWLKNVGDKIVADDGLLEVATDKVDTEIPSEVSGILKEILVQVNEVAKIGQVVAIIETDAEVSLEESKEKFVENELINLQEIPNIISESIKQSENIVDKVVFESSDNYYSPLVKNIAEKEGISIQELDSINGSGLNKRVTKEDLFRYLENRKETNTVNFVPKIDTIETPIPLKNSVATTDEVIMMDRMGKLIADHMIKSKEVSAHVQSFIEIDVTKIVFWRNQNKELFFKKTGENLTFTPIFLMAVAQTIGEYPMVNISVDGDKIIKKHNINLGMAAALPDGNLIVPVIKNADQLNLIGMTKMVNKLANAARNNKLSPDDIQGGTYTVTNVGTFGSITGTPIINQPQVAILALGAIRKMPAVVESPEGDYIGIRHKMIVAHSYDHRVINGALGGKFILKLKEILENFDETPI